MRADSPSIVQRWPYAAAPTFVGLMWIAYGWSVWIGGGLSSHAGGIGFGSLTNGGYEIAGALDTTAVVEGGEWERLVSGIFLHGGFLHLILNSAAILQLGRILEAFSTRGRCWLTLLISGLAGSLATVAWARIAGPSSSVGASGAACGLGAAIIVLSRGIPGLSEFRKQMITWVAVMLAMGLMPMISGTGHLGGAIGGAIAGVLVGRRGFVVARNDRWSRLLDVLAWAFTLLFAAALAVDVVRAPARKADLAQVDAMIEDVYVWLDAQALPSDVGAWIARAEAGDLSAQAERERNYVVAAVGWLREMGGKISADDAGEIREGLAAIQNARRW